MNDNEKQARVFRNAVYQHLADSGVSDDIASRIAVEAEGYVEMYQTYLLRGIESAMRQNGFDLTPTPGMSVCKSCWCMTKTIDGKCGKCKEVKS